MLKSFLVLLVICLTINLTKQEEIELNANILAKNIDLKLKELETKLKNTDKEIVEINQIVCGCDENQPEKCTQTPSDATLQRVIRSIEQPITALFEKIKQMAMFDSNTSDNITMTTSSSEIHVMSYSSACQNKTTIKCGQNQIIKVTQAMLSNKKKDACPSSKPSTETTCDETVKSTELASELCNNKTECTFSVENDFGSLCECATQKYLDLTYTCVSEQESVTTTTERAKREKRLARLFYRIQPHMEEQDKRIRERFNLGLGAFGHEGRHEHSAGRHENSAGRHENSAGRYENSAGRYENPVGRYENRPSRYNRKQDGRGYKKRPQRRMPYDEDEYEEDECCDDDEEY